MSRLDLKCFFKHRFISSDRRRLPQNNKAATSADYRDKSVSSETIFKRISVVFLVFTHIRFPVLLWFNPMSRSTYEY